MGEAVDTIPSILNKCLFVSPLQHMSFGKDLGLCLLRHVRLIARIRYLSRVMRKPYFCTCETKGADQLRRNCAADQRFCFRYIDSTIALLPKFEISRL